MSVLGLIDIFWNGVKLDNEPGATVMLGGVRNTEVVFTTKVAPARKMFATKVTCTVPVQSGERVSDKFGTDTGELQVHCDTGQIFSWDEAFLTEALEFTAGEGGKLKLTFMAGAPVEI